MTKPKMARKLVARPCQDCETGACPCGAPGGCTGCEHTGVCQTCQGTGTAHLSLVDMDAPRPGPSAAHVTGVEPREDRRSTGRGNRVRTYCPVCGRRERQEKGAWYLGLSIPERDRYLNETRIALPRCLGCATSFRNFDGAAIARAAEADGLAQWRWTGHRYTYDLISPADLQARRDALRTRPKAS